MDLKVFDFVLIGLLGLALWALAAGESAGSGQALQHRYIGELEGVRIYLVCVDGQWLSFSKDTSSGFHILAPFIKEAGLGIDLPTCKS